MINHARLVFSVPKPPSKQSTRDKPDETLAWINKRLSEMITAFEQNADENPVLDSGAYMVIYSTIHQYTVSSMNYNGEPPAKWLYDGLADAIRSHCKYVRTRILRSHSEATDTDLAIMETYAREWNRHCKLAKLIAHNYRYMERHWIKREQDAGKPGVHTIQDLHSVIWREEVIIGSSQSCWTSKAEVDDPESILDIAVRFCRREGFDPEEGLGEQASDLLRDLPEFRRDWHQDWHVARHEGRSYALSRDSGAAGDLAQWLEDHCPSTSG